MTLFQAHGTASEMTSHALLNASDIALNTRFAIGRMLLNVFLRKAKAAFAPPDISAYMIMTTPPIAANAMTAMSLNFFTAPPSFFAIISANDLSLRHISAIMMPIVVKTIRNAM